jgi:hypothetical protein
VDDRYPGQLALPVRVPDRRFRLWSYVPSHSELVLRTDFEPDELHVELLFKPVYQINLPVVMDGGLVVDSADRSPGRTGAVVFTVSSDRFSGHVVAEYLFLRQEQRSKYSPFSLFHGYLREKAEQ